MTNGGKSCKKLQPMLREIETPVYLPTHPSLHFKSFASILLHLREDWEVLPKLVFVIANSSLNPHLHDN